MNLDNVGFETGTAGLLTAMVALQQANGIDLETAISRVEATLHSSTALIQTNTWADLQSMWRWFATPPEPGSIPAPGLQT